MNEKNLKMILNVLEEHGIETEGMNMNDELEMDSIQYVSIIVALEEVFDTSISDEYLVDDKITIDSFYNMVKELQKTIKYLF